MRFANVHKYPRFQGEHRVQSSELFPNKQVPADGQTL